MANSGSRPTLIVFSGGMRDTAVERMVAGARDAAALDTLGHGADSGAFGEQILVTDSEELACQAPPGVEVDLDKGPFDFETRLRGLISSRKIARPFYVGGGSLPLTGSADLGRLAERLARSEEIVLSNNFFSADFVAWSPGSAIERLSTIPSDNRLPMILHGEAGLAHWEPERTIASQFDIDAPADVAVLKLYRAGGERLRRYVESVAMDLDRYLRAMDCFLEPKIIVVAGRVASATWQYLERETVCRVRVLSEERGMQADGRERSGQVRSILGFYLAKAGVDGLIGVLAELGEAVFLDTRVLYAHAGVYPSRSERFLSDLGEWQQIADPLVRELTRAAAAANVPMVLGGHSLVSGGIMALVQAAWEAQERASAPR